VFFQGAATFNWRDAGLGIRGGSSIQIGETAREAARPPDIFTGCRNMKLEGCRPRHPRGFFDSDRRNGSRGRSPSRYFFRVRNMKLEGCRPRHPRGFFDPDWRLGRGRPTQILGQRGRYTARDPFGNLRQKPRSARSSSRRIPKNLGKIGRNKFTMVLAIMKEGPTKKLP